MAIFPTSSYTFRLFGDEAETLDRLKRRTAFSENLTSINTDKSFRGKVEGPHFRLISAEIGKGAFCVLDGQTRGKDGQLTIEINKGFRILLSIILLFPVVGIVATAISEEDKPFIILLAMGIVQILMIRYVFIEVAFRILSRASINRLNDVMDMEWIKKD